MMSTCILALTLVCGVSEVNGPTRQPSGKEVAALVSALSGSASVNQPRGTQLKLFDWVRAGATVDVPRGSRLILVLSNGSRFELEGPARATVTAGALSASSGSVRALSAVPPLPQVAPIADRKQAGRHSAAVRVRGPRITGLYPSSGAVTRAGSTVFAFGAVKGAAQYALDVDDASGTRVFQIQTEQTQVAMPTALKPGAIYYWRVRTIDRVGAQAHGEAEFTTLEAKDEQARDALRGAVAITGDPHGLGLLAHVDYALGLFREARDGVRAALDKSPEDPKLRDALVRLAQQLEAVGVQGGSAAPAPSRVFGPELAIPDSRATALGETPSTSAVSTLLKSGDVPSPTSDFSSDCGAVRRLAARQQAAAAGLPHAVSQTQLPAASSPHAVSRIQLPAAGSPHAVSRTQLPAAGSPHAVSQTKLPADAQPPLSP